MVPRQTGEDGGENERLNGWWPEKKVVMVLWCCGFDLGEVERVQVTATRGRNVGGDLPSTNERGLEIDTRLGGQ